MFFINERLTLEQRAEFNSWGIMQPFFGFGRVISEKPLKPLYWTVDKEREIYLLKTSYDGDYPDEHVFIFIWNKKDYRWCCCVGTSKEIFNRQCFSVL